MNKNIFQLCGSITEQEALKLDDRFLANLKYDGERVISILTDEVILLNRRGNIVNSHFKSIVTELIELKNKCKLDFLRSDTILDGEIISYDDDFGKLQSQAHSKEDKGIKCFYMIFDILKFAGQDLRNEQLKDRITMLQGIFKESNFEFLKLAEYKQIGEMLQQAKAENREGIIIKDMTAKYENRRSDNWLKLKFFEDGEITLVRYTENPKGIRGEDRFDNAVQVAGKQSLEVKNRINKDGECRILIQYLEKTENNRYRFISFRGIK